jgi:flavin reductase (DIM6/NTAB) family NADH-FMN oxidoreductase RutF
MNEAVRSNDAGLFRSVMARFATGVTLVAAKCTDGSVRAMTANAFMSGSLEPPLCVICVARRAHLHACLEGARDFSVSVLARGQEAFSNHFAGRPVEGLDPSFVDVDGVPVLSSAIAQIVCSKTAAHECGDHTLFIGAIRILRSRRGEPLVYYDGQYGSFRKSDAHIAEDVPPIW